MAICACAPGHAWVLCMHTLHCMACMTRAARSSAMQHTHGTPATSRRMHGGSHVAHANRCMEHACMVAATQSMRNAAWSMHGWGQPCGACETPHGACMHGDADACYRSHGVLVHALTFGAGLWLLHT
eukprot:359649-Chlamydomonas_euryale.AAC.5